MSNVATPEWVKDAVFYHIFPDRFARSEHVPKPANLQAWGAEPTHHAFQGGDLLGIAEKLDYLSDLGINAIYLNPIFASAANHRFHTYDYFRVDPILGGDEAFRAFLDAAHERGIRVILDGVLNHCGRGFFQFHHLMECGRESPYIRWFHANGWPLNAYNETEASNYAAWWGLHALPKFNTGHPPVREFLWRVGTHWLEHGIDGWRIDVPNEIDDDSFWRTFRQRCRAVNSEAYLVGEFWDEARRWLGGDMFDGQMNYPLARAIIGFFGAGRIDGSAVAGSGYGHIPALDGPAFAGRLEQLNQHLYPEQIVQAQMNLLGSHDTPRALTVACGDKAALRLMFLCLLTQPGAPTIYYGDEVGVAGGRDPENRRAFPWHKPESWEHNLRADIRRFIALRHELPALRRGRFRVICAQRDVVVYGRFHQGRDCVIAFNAGSEPQQVSLGWTESSDARLPWRLSSDRDLCLDVLASGAPVVLPPRSGHVWAD